ncbi:MAG: uracil-DNA glycosylase [Alphaproteobacteria bacterium]|nr:uracil-DNA glycosylase [Alphaproteobacteria bacterium]
MNEIHSSHDLAATLQWYLDIGLDEGVFDVPQNRLAEKMVADSYVSVSAPSPVLASPSPSPSPLGTAEALATIAPLLANVSSLEGLQNALGQFDGLAIKKTAGKMVFGDGHAQARLMVVGEIPDDADDHSGKPFSGESGQLLDKMMGAIGLSRGAEDRIKAVYMTQVLNWRPPGNRTPNASEIDLSLPFLKKHIELVQPEFLLLMGSVPAKALLGRTESMTKLRGQWFEYQGIPALVSFPPSFLLKSPAKKREAWDDLQDLQKRMS